MPQTLLAPGELVGSGYEIIESLGHGGMSEVYKARELSTGNLVVLKIPDSTMMGDVAIYARWERETRVGERLDHPSIQRLLRAGEMGTGTGPFHVLEYVEGELLRTRLQRGGRLAPEEAIRISIQLADALGYCHSLGVIHRDLKPENVLITPSGQVKLIDFGIALLQGARRLTFGALSTTMGTPEYMAPEQVQGARGDARTDIYALGVMLYEMLTGRTPFVGDDPLEVMAEHVRVEAPRLRELRPDLPPALDAIVAKALRRDPNERYVSMEEMRQDLEHPDAMDLELYAWPDSHQWRGLAVSVGPMPSFWRAAAVVLVVFAILALVGIAAQMGHQAHLGH